MLPAARALARSLRVLLGTFSVASCPPLRAPVAGTQLCLRAVPSFLNHAPGVPLSLQLRQRDGRRRALGRRGADVPRPPRGQGLGGERLEGLVWVWLGRYFALSLPTAAAAAAAGEAPVARAGSFPCFRGMLGATAWPSEAVARLARAAVATPGAPSLLPSAAAAAVGDAPGSCAGATPRVGGVPGTAVGARWGCDLRLRASGAPSRGGAAGLAAWAAGAVTSAGSGSWAGGGGPTSTAPPPSSAPRAPRGSPPSTLGRPGSGSGTGGGGGRPAGGSDWSLPSLLSW